MDAITPHQHRMYQRAVNWIAHNDNAGDEEDREALSGYLTVVLVADLFNCGQIEVADDVLFRREAIAEASR